jgi:hypothetical protein
MQRSEDIYYSTGIGISRYGSTRATRELKKRAAGS